MVENVTLTALLALLTNIRYVNIQLLGGVPLELQGEGLKED